TVSPDRNGLNSNIITPPAKFDSVPEKAIPTAKPAEAKIATKDVISIPSCVIAVTATNNLTIPETRDDINPMRLLSTSLLDISLLTAYDKNPANQNPTTNKMTATINLEPY